MKKAPASMDLAAALALVQSKQPPAVFLLHGDDFLCRTAIQELTGLLVPESMRSLNLVELDAGAGPRQVADEVATLPMFRGTKVVTVQPAEFLAPKKSARGDPFAKARELWESGRQKEAARRVLALAGRAGFVLQGLAVQRAADWKSGGFNVTGKDLDLIARVAELAMGEGLAIPESDTRPLEELLARGLPAGHHLLLAVEELEEKGTLARLCAEQGVEIVRELPGKSVGFGQRESRDLAGLAEEVLGPLGKRLEPAAEKLLAQAAHADARALASELEKLASYVGDAQVITAADVQALVAAGASGDLFAVSNAVEARDKVALVSALDEELGRGAVPLQLLGSLTSAVRGLLMARARLSSLGIERRLSFQEFERKAASAFAEADQKAGRKPGHPFRAFKRAEAALKYSLAELSEGLVELARADAGIKRGMDGRLWLVRLALRLCS